jgi:hypothetical protein
MVLFLHWICETYLTKKQKKGKRKSLNQYWRDFKMLYRCVNGSFVDANDADEVVKVIIILSNVILVLYANCNVRVYQQYFKARL